MTASSILGNISVETCLACALWFARDVHCSYYMGKRYLIGILSSYSKSIYFVFYVKRDKPYRSDLEYSTPVFFISTTKR